MAVAQAKLDLAESLLVTHGVPTGRVAKWAKDARAAAAAQVRKDGGPVRRDEYWRFTNPAPLTTDPADAALFDGKETPVFETIDRLRITFVDGHFRPDLSDELAGEGLEISTLDAAMQTDIHWASGLFGVLEGKGQTPVSRPLAALNTATAAEGLVVRVSGRPSRPLAIRYERSERGADAMIHHAIQLEAGAELTLLETGPGADRLNTCAEVDLGAGARFHHIRTQGRDHERVAATHCFARLGPQADFHSFTLTANGRLTRNETIVDILGDGAHARVSGAALGDGKDFVHDDTVFITHDAVDCESRQVFKKVLRNGASGVFQGKILVKPDAQKTDGYQISQGLLLDEDSNFLAKPELEIYADDVACSHGSTCGAVDETALFYLMSRGIPRARAQDMLVLAFVDEAIQEIEDERLAEDIRARLAQWVDRHHG